MKARQQLIHKGLTASPSKHIVEVSGIKGVEVAGIKALKRPELTAMEIEQCGFVSAVQGIYSGNAAGNAIC